MIGCTICTNNLHGSPDQIVLCEHKQGIVHMGCCTHKCSMDGKPCVHSKAIYGKVK